MTGIYKITSPSGGVYIGQSTDIDRRIRNHYDSILKKSVKTKLKSSFIKHGFSVHEVKVVHELPSDVSKEVLNTYEKLYLNAYQDCGVSVLNLGLPGIAGGYYSDEAREKMRVSQTGKKQSAETVAKRLQTIKDRGKKAGVKKGYKWAPGRKQSDKAIALMKKRMTGRAPTEPQLAKTKATWALKIENGFVGPFTGKKHSEETKRKISKIQQDKRK